MSYYILVFVVSIMFVSKSTLDTVLGALPVQVQPISYRRRKVKKEASLR